MNNILKDKGIKFWISLLIGIMCLGGVGGCAPGDDNINGHYRFEKIIYMIGASSHLVTKDNADAYIIADNSLTILHIDGTKEQITASFEKSEVDIEAFAALFTHKMDVPDISSFQKRYQYSINQEYRLYVMDGEVWLAACANNIMWSIYRLVKIED